MKNSKFITAIFSALLFCISGTAFAGNVVKPTVPLGQSIEDYYSVPPTFGSAPTAYLSDFSIPGTKLLLMGCAAVAGVALYHYTGAEGITCAGGSAAMGWEWLDLKQRTHQAFQESGKPLSNNQIFYSSYRAEQVITNDISTYTFQFNKRSKLVSPNTTTIVTEQLLADNDVCIVGQIGMFLIARLNTAPARVTPLTYDSFTPLETDAGGTQEDYKIFYNGTMVIKTGITTTRPILTSDFYVSPGAALQQALLATGGQAADNARDARGYNDGYVWVGSNAPFFSGRADQEIQVTVYPFAGIDVEADTSNWSCYLCCVIRGFTLFNKAEADETKAFVEYGFLDKYSNVQKALNKG